MKRIIKIIKPTFKEKLRNFMMDLSGDWSDKNFSFSNSFFFLFGCFLIFFLFDWSFKGAFVGGIVCAAFLYIWYRIYFYDGKI